MKKLLALISFVLSVHIRAADYIFPLAIQQPPGYDHELLLVGHYAYQSVTLYLWDPQSLELTLVLPSFYHPYNVISLYGRNGFSFMESGLVRLNNYIKRSPKTITLENRKIIEHQVVRWLEDGTFLLSAWHYHPQLTNSGKVDLQKRLGIYHANQQGAIATITQDSSYDCLYPQITDDALFFVQRTLNDDQQFEYQIMQRRIEAEEIEHLFELPKEHECYDLRVLSRMHGLYCLQERLDASKKEHQKTPYHYYYFYLDAENEWQHHKICPVYAPFMGPNDPFGLFCPALVQSDGAPQILFFISGPLLCAYDFKNNKNKIVLQSKERAFCAPIICNNKVYCGCSLQKKDPRFWRSDHFQLYLDLPCYDFVLESTQ